MTTIRPATPSDIPLIRSLAYPTFSHTYRSILSAEQLDYMLEMMYSEDSMRRQFADGHHYLLAYADGEAVGYASYNREGESLYHLQKLYVLPTRQGEGVGKRLFDAACSAVGEECPGAAIELNVNRNNSALHFYERMGMTRLRSGDFDIGNGFFMNDYIMGLRL